MNVRDLSADDAPALVALFRRCYGDTYGSPEFYDEQALHARIENRSLRSVVAVDGELLRGHMGMSIRHAGALICETGNTVVDPEARGQGLLKKLGLALAERVVREGFVGYVHYPTTAHPIMQRASVEYGGQETGVMFAYVPSDTEYEAVDQPAGRLAATVAYQPLASVPTRDVIAPARYRDILSEMYARCGLDRTIRQSSERMIENVSAVESHFHARRSALHIHVSHTGNDLAAQVRAKIAIHRPAITHVDLKLDDDALNAAVDALRGEGFYFCALLPEFADTDILRLQRLNTAEESDFNPPLVNHNAQRITSFIREDIP